MSAAHAKVLYVDASGRSWASAAEELAAAYELVATDAEDLPARLAETSEYVAILLDLDLATSRGEALQAPVSVPETQQVPVVLVTQRARECSDDELRQRGADCAIPKPVSLGQVTLAIAEWHLRR